MRTVRVEWEGPLSLDEVKALDDEDEDCGLYQIYGRHIIFGDNSLLYIGKTEQQTFCYRFAQHAEWLEEEEGVFVHIGRIVEEDYVHDPPDWSDWANVLKDAEALTINYETYNGQRLEVVNLGNYRSLCEKYRG